MFCVGKKNSTRKAIAKEQTGTIRQKKRAIYLKLPIKMYVI